MHQDYDREPPSDSYRLVDTPTPRELDSPEFRDTMDACAASLRAAGVATVVLMHGSFVGDDPAGTNAWFDCTAPRFAARLRGRTKPLIDAVLKNRSNFDPHYRDVVAAALDADRPPPIEVERFIWSGENNHIGRADAAVRLIDWLANRQPPPGGRVLFFAHSHGGNALALVSQLRGAVRRAQAAPPSERSRILAPVRAFFEQTERYYATSAREPIRDDVWPRVRERLLSLEVPAADAALDLVTLGTPVRYGWDPHGYENLLHFVNHAPRPGRSVVRGAQPRSPLALFRGSDGDYVQQLGIAGSNFPPLPGITRASEAEHGLAPLLGPRRNWYDLSRQFPRSPRVADAGRTILARYPRDGRMLAGHFFGHGVYTQFRWLSFQFEATVAEFYNKG